MKLLFCRRPAASRSASHLQCCGPGAVEGEDEYTMVIVHGISAIRFMLRGIPTKKTRTVMDACTGFLESTRLGVNGQRK